ncbi:MAG: hypothetical protein HQL38_18430 [Alphaproteobacteria bacterium]|nr:hypothetical protein [Alphaproteobacteria bacterium]
MDRTKARADAQAVAARLAAALETGVKLGDPRASGAIAAWAGICQGVPDETVRQLIPGLIRLMFRNSAMAPKLARAGLREKLELQHESIPPFVLSFRRMQAIRAAGGDFDPAAMVSETRRELRELNARFHAVLDEAIRLDEENRRLREQVAGLETAVEKSRKEAAASLDQLEEARARALSKLKYALENLRDAQAMRHNDPENSLVAAASVTAQSYFMLCEDLGRGHAAIDMSRRILGERMGAL